MKNFKYLKTIFSGLALSLALCPQVWAAWETRTCSDSKGINCWQCGDNCTATLYQDGTLRVIGTGSVTNAGGSFSGSSVKPTSLVIEEGITFLSNATFGGISSISAVSLPDSLRRGVQDYGLQVGGNGISTLTIGPNTVLSDGFFWQRVPTWAPNMKIICRGNVKSCEEKNKNYFLSKNVTVTYTNEVINNDGKLLRAYNNDGSYTYYTYDSSGNLIATYDSNDNVLSSYAYNPDGSVEIYDANGKLTGLKNAKYITPAQAAELTKPGKNNTVTLTFK